MPFTRSFRPGGSGCGARGQLASFLGGLLQKMEGDSSVCNVSDVLLGQQNTAHFPSRDALDLKQVTFCFSRTYSVSILSRFKFGFKNYPSLKNFPVLVRCHNVLGEKIALISKRRKYCPISPILATKCFACMVQR